MVTEVPVAAAAEPVVSAPVVEEVAEVVEAPRSGCRTATGSG